MDTARWQRLEAAFHETVDLPDGPERDAVLTRVCGTDAALIAEVQRLLAEDHDLHRGEAPDPHVGLRVESYQIDRLVARGGMAAVYAAHRADDQFHQRVAIKIMDARLSDPALAAQFRAERQILATLEHPALTRLLDGGVTAFGAPYLVMEYVDGVSIDRYCDDHRLDIAARVQLFRQVCDGIAFAHATLVLHRDLKPSNVMVTSSGHPKIVDFGTATLLRPDRMATTSRAPLTPAYASPEQLTGQAVGTASDQYSLGLLLYELLTGVPPFGTGTSYVAWIERAMSDAPPTAAHAVVGDTAAAARRTSPAALRRTLTGDLGRIVQKALAHDPTQRYASVAQLSDDLGRWTRGEPILARPPSVVYRASRFVSKHWVATALAAALATTLVVATVTAVQQARRSSALAARAQAESARAQAVNQFLTAMLSSANPTWVNAGASVDGPLTVRRVLDGASELLNSRSGVAPEAEAEMRRTLGQTFLGMGAFSEARPHLERALDLYRRQGDAHGVARTQAALGLEAVQRGDMEGAEPVLREALAFVRSGGAAGDPELHFTVLNDLGGAIGHRRPGDAEALALLGEAVEVAHLAGIDHGGASVALLHLGTEQLRTGHLDAAEASLTDALQRMDRASRDLPERNSVLRALSTLMLGRGDAAAAERLGAEAVAGAARTRPADHPLQPSYKVVWGAALVALGRLDEGEAQLQAALAAYRAIRPAGHFELMGPLAGLGAAARLDGRYQDAETLLREARAISLRHPEHRDRLAEIAGELGLTLRAQGRHAEAEALLQESHAISREAFGEAHPWTKRAAARRGAPDR